MTDIGKRKWWVLGAISLAVIVVGVNMTVLNIALPTLATALHASSTELQLISASFSLILTAGLLIGGLFGDRFGRKKMLLLGLSLFGAGSLASAFATTPAALIFGQALLGLGAAFIIPLTMSVLTIFFSDKERPLAIAIWSGVSFISLPLGPVLGGWILTRYWWGLVFLINVPVVIADIVALLVLLPESRNERRLRFDPLGISLAIVGFIGFIFGLVQAGKRGWGDAQAVSLIVGSLVILTLFVFWERRFSKKPDTQPAVDPTLFRSSGYTWGTMLVALAFFAFYGLLFVLPQYFQAILRTDALDSGLRLLPMIGGLMVGAIMSQRIVSRIGANVTVASGFILIVVGLSVGAGFTGDDTLLAAWMTIFGLGMGLILAAASSVALEGLPTDKSGSGSALMQMFQRAGGSFGIAILGSILNYTYRGRLNVKGLPADAAASARESVFAGLQVAQKLGSRWLRESAQASFAQGMDHILWTCGIFAAAGVVLSLLFLPHRRRTLHEDGRNDQGENGHE